MLGIKQSSLDLWAQSFFSSRDVISKKQGQLTHVKTSSNACTLEGLVLSVLLAGLHETRHLILGELDLAATEGGQRDIGDLELVGGSRHCDVI